MIHASLLFLLGQMLVIIFMLVVATLSGAMGDHASDASLYFTFALALAAEVVLIAVLITHIRQRLRRVVAIADSIDEREPPLPKQAVADERTLERMMLAGAAIAAAWAAVFGTGTVGVRFAIAVVEAFALLFMVIFVAVRAWMTNETRFTALLTIVLLAFAVYWEFSHF